MTANREDHPMNLTRTRSDLLADPTEVAAVRALITHARTRRADHVVYSTEGGTGQRALPKEHTFTLHHDRVSVCAGWLTYRCDGVTLLTARAVNAKRVAQLLAAVGVLPERFTAARVNEPTNPARRCRRCGATTRLRMIITNPLIRAAREWECHDGCEGGAR